MPEQDLFELIARRWSEIRLLRLAEVRYITTYIRALEASSQVATATVHPLNRAATRPKTSLTSNKRGYLVDRGSTPNAEPQIKPDSPNVPSLLINNKRNRRILRRRRARQANQENRRQHADIT